MATGKVTDFREPAPMQNDSPHAFFVFHPRQSA